MNNKKFLRELGRQLNVIVYEMNGEIYMRSKPEKVRQHRNSQSTANTFRAGVKLSALVRKALFSILPNAKDRKMMHHIDRQLINGFKSIGVRKNAPLPIAGVLEKLSLTPGIQLATRMTRIIRAKWDSSKGWSIRFPEVNPTNHFSAPKGTHSIKISFSTAVCDLSQWTVTDTIDKSFTIDYGQPKVAAKFFTLPIFARPGELSIVAVSLQFHTPKASYGNRPAFRPAQIIGAVIVK